MSDIDQLLNMFGRMGTTDHDVLVKQFLVIVPQSKEDEARFFLEMNNYNLQNSIGAYFEYSRSNPQQQSVSFTQTALKPQMTFITKNISGSSPEDPVNAGTKFSRFFEIANNGNAVWPANCYLHFIGGEIFKGEKEIGMPSLYPGQKIEIALHFQAPNKQGVYSGSWMMSFKGPSSFMFGEPIWIIANVAGNIEVDNDEEMKLDKSSEVGFNNQVSSFNSTPPLDDENSYMNSTSYHNHQQQTPLYGEGFKFGEVRTYNNNVLNNPFEGFNPYKSN